MCLCLCLPTVTSTHHLRFLRTIPVCMSHSSFSRYYPCLYVPHSNTYPPPPFFAFQLQQRHCPMHLQQRSRKDDHDEVFPQLQPPRVSVLVRGKRSARVQRWAFSISKFFRSAHIIHIICDALLPYPINLHFFPPPPPPLPLVVDRSPRRGHR